MASKEHQTKREPLAVLRKRVTELTKQIEAKGRGYHRQEGSVASYENDIKGIDSFLSWEFEEAIGVKPPALVRMLANKRRKVLRAKMAVVKAEVKAFEKELDLTKQRIKEGTTDRHKCPDCGVMHVGEKSG